MPTHGTKASKLQKLWAGRKQSRDLPNVWREKKSDLFFCEWLCRGGSVVVVCSDIKYSCNMHR